MIFEIEHTILAGETMDLGWSWSLRKVDKGEPGEVMATSPTRFMSEAACRSHIGRAKIAMRGARFAKTVVKT